VAEQVAEQVRAAGVAPTTLPPGAYLGADGGVYRDVPARTGRVREVKSPDGKVIRREAVLRTVTRRVQLVADTSPVGVIRALRAAKLAADEHGPDVYHPVYRDWFRGGAKREHDLPQNTSDAMVGPVMFVPIEDDPELSVVEQDPREESDGER